VALTDFGKLWLKTCPFFKNHHGRQARSQDFVMGELIRGFGGKASSRRRQRVWGRNPSARRILRFFNKNNAFL